MTVLEIRRLTTSIHVDATALLDTGAADDRPAPADAGPDPIKNFEAWGLRLGKHVEDAIGTRLAAAWAAASERPGLWCVRRVDLRLDVNARSAGAEVSSQWPSALVAQVVRALSASGELVYYAQEVDAVADAVRGIVTGDFRRAWAWRLLGVILPRDGHGPGDRVRAMLAHRPHVALSVISQVANRDLAALDQALGPEGWAAVARIAWAAAGGTEPPRMPPPDARIVSDSAAGATPDEPGQTRARSQDAAADPSGADLTTPDPTRLGARLIAHRQADGATLDAWAVLTALDGDPAVAHRGDAAARVTSARTALLPSTALPGVRAGARSGVADVADDTPVRIGATDLSPERQRAQSTGDFADVGLIERRQVEAVHSPYPAGGAEPAHRPSFQEPILGSESSGVPHAAVTADPPPDLELGEPTVWAGLPFLLTVAADASLPERLLDETCCATRPIWWALHAIAGLLCEAPADDPARLALAGCGQSRRLALRLQPAPDPSERAALGELADAWAAAVAARLNSALVSPTSARAAVARVVHRPGRVVAVPGWIEVHLLLQDVDLDVRRVALDADPGWIPWLGVVVRYVYE